MQGSLAHDALYQFMREGLLSRMFKAVCDFVLKRICLEDGMSKIRAWYVHRAVKNFGAASIDIHSTIIQGIGVC